MALLHNQSLKQFHNLMARNSMLWSSVYLSNHKVCVTPLDGVKIFTGFPLLSLTSRAKLAPFSTVIVVGNTVLQIPNIVHYWSLSTRLLTFMMCSLDDSLCRHLFLQSQICHPVPGKLNLFFSRNAETYRFRSRP